MQNQILFIQKRSTRGGAQVALSRLLTAPKMREMNPLVITSDPSGWLPQELKRVGIDCMIESIPSVRSLTSRLWGNLAFAKRIARKIGRPLAVIANNHEEALLAAETAELLNTKSAVILRDPYLTKDILERYEWDAADHTLAVGPDLADMATGASASIPVTTIYDSVIDFADPAQKATTFPDTVLVVGSNHPRKGWRELIEAIGIAGQMERGFQAVRFVFSGDAPHGISPSGQLSFAGHTTEFFNRLRQHRLVVNPSKSESFGLAPVEALAAGVPLLTTNTGVMSFYLRLPNEWTLPVVEPTAIAERLVWLFRNWAGVESPVATAQDAIRNLFSAENAAAPILDSIARMQCGE